MKEKETQIQIIDSTELMSEINRSEVDMQIRTAKQYPRDIDAALSKIKKLATIDTETAEDCFYALRRGGDLIEGVSVRLAEIIAASWGNLRVQTRIVGNDGRQITAIGICHDLESNLAVSVEVKRRITDRNGRRFSDDLQIFIGNVVSVIAFRNAVLKVVPKAVTKKAVEEIKDVAVGKAFDLEDKRNRAIDFFKSLNFSEEQLLQYLKINSIGEIQKEQIFELRGLVTAIKEGTTTIQETFPNPKKTAQSTNEKVSKIEAAMMESEQPKTELF